MYNKILTIIVPAYNMEKYLSRCLESVLVPEVIDCVEILIINDGSKDKTLEIAKTYQKKHNKTITVIDKENGNYGSVINMGIELASGKYIKTLDADDWYDKEGFVKFITMLKECDEDLVISGYSYYFADKDKVVPAFTYKEKYWGETIDIIKHSLYELKFEHMLYMPALTFKTTKIRDAKFKLLEKTYYTDTEYIYYPYSQIQTIRLLPINLYIYYIGRLEQSVNKSNVLKNFDSKYRIIQRLLDDYINDNEAVYSKNKRYILVKNIGGFYSYLYITDEHREEINRIDNKIKETLFDLYEELGETVNYLGVEFLKLHRQGADYETINKQIERAKKKNNSFFNKIIMKFVKILKSI